MLKGQMMKFKHDANVYTADGKDVGRIERVVMDPISKEVTHVIVRQGFIFTEDKAVPIDYFYSQSEDSVVLRSDIADLDSIPRFEETHYVPAHLTETDMEPGSSVVDAYYWYPPAGAAHYPTLNMYGVPLMASTGERPYGTDQPYIERTKQNIPEDTVALEEGARVVSADDQHVGDIEQVLMDSESNYATHIVISQGLLLKTHKLVPTFWFSTVTEDEVTLAVPASFLEQLPDYEGESA